MSAGEEKAQKSIVWEERKDKDSKETIACLRT